MSSAEPHRIYARPIIRDGRHYHGGEGPMYSAHHDGSEIVAMTRQPLLDGARVLQARGFTGPVELWDDTRPFPRMRSTVEAAAELTVQENEKTSPRFMKYRPFNATLRRSEIAGSSEGSTCRPEPEIAV